MKKIKRYLCVAVAVMMLFLTGCGTELYELTEEEEDLIVHSAAYLIAKHNSQQKDGVNGYPLPESFEEDESESEFESESESESESEGNGNGSGVDEDNVKPSEEMISLAELIGHKDSLKITYEGSYVSKSYKEGVAYVVEADAGKAFYVMKIKMTNTTGQDVTVNNAAKSPIMKLVSDAVTVKSEVTFLSNDFSTYQGKIAAGESVETLLLFEVSEKVAEKITAPKLQITIEKSTKTIKL